MTKQSRFGQPANYNASPETRTNGETSALEVDASGNLKTISSGAGVTSTQTQGAAASNAAAVGNPVMTGAKYNVTPQVFDDGDVADNQADINGNQKVTQATSFDEDIDAITNYSKEYTYTKVSASGVISAVPVGFCGYYVSASASGVVTFWDNASAGSGDSLVATSKAITTNDLLILENPISMVNGIYFTLVSGTATVFALTRKKVAA